MKNILLKIANTLVVNKQNLDRIGLLKGLTGSALFLYQYSCYTKNETYNILADDILDDIFESLKNINVYDIEYGLSGIGWCVEYLILNNFVEGESDEVLEDIDIRLFDVLKNKKLENNNIDIPLLNHGLYILSRIKNKSTTENQLEIIKNILNQIDISLDNEDPYPIVYLNSIIYFLFSLNNKNIQDNVISILLNKLPNAITKSIKAGLFDCSDYETFILLIDIAFQHKNNSWIKLIQLRNEWNLEATDYSIDRFIKNAWQNLFYPEIKYANNTEYDFDKIVYEKQQCLTNDNLTMSHGLVGIGLGILQNMTNIS